MESQSCRSAALARGAWQELDAEELFQLAAQGGGSAVRVSKSLLARGVPPNLLLRRTLRFRYQSTMVTEVSALHVACAMEQPDVVATLLQAGADPNLRTGMGETPLHLAIRSTTKCSRRTICGALLQHRADVSLTSADGETALQAAERQHGSKSKIAGFLRKPPDRNTLREEARVGGTSHTPRLSLQCGLSVREMRLFEAQVDRSGPHQALVDSDDDGCTANATPSDWAFSCERKGEEEEEEEDEEVCGICLGELHLRSNDELPEEVWRLPCSGHHCFHAKCARPWLRRSGACPTCRMPVVPGKVASPS